MPPPAIPVSFIGSSLQDIKRFPDTVMRLVGVEINRLQQGFQPTDFKPMKTVGKGVNEIRIQENSEAFRVFYVMKLGCIYILHAFHKKTQKTEKREKDLVKTRLKQIAP